MAVDIVASAGVFDAAAEAEVMAGVYQALLAAIDATDDERVASIMGVSLHVLPAARMMIGGRVAPSVRIDVVLPAVALASFRRRRRFIADATAADAWKRRELPCRWWNDGGLTNVQKSSHHPRVQAAT